MGNEVGSMKTIELEFDEYPDDVYRVVVSPIPLSGFEKLGDLYSAAAEQFLGHGKGDGIRSLVAEFVKVAKPTVNGKAAKLLDGDPNLTLAIVRQWHAGVRNVPLPLPRASSATGPSPEL